MKLHLDGTIKTKPHTPIVGGTSGMRPRITWLDTKHGVFRWLLAHSSQTGSLHKLNKMGIKLILN